MLVKTIGRMILCLLALTAPVVVAQTTQGGIVGAVRDEKGADIAGAKITVTNEATGLQRDFATTGNGMFRVLALPSGNYDKGRSAGFATSAVKAVEVGVDQVRTLIWSCGSDEGGSH